MNHISLRRFSAVLLLLAGAALGAAAQPERPWSVSLYGGTAFGQGTFRSITEQALHWGYQGGLSASYRFSRFLSLEAGGQFAATSQYALDCCQYWLSADGQRYIAPVPGETGWDYQDLRTDTKWGKVYLQANLDLLCFVTQPTSRWSLTVSPQVSVVTTQTRRVAPTLISPSGQATDYNYLNPRQWHLGLGGQASVGFQITQDISAALYGGITCLTGERFDNIPEHVHKSNLLWDAGVKLSYRFGGAGKRARAAAELAAAEEAARLAAEREAAERARIAAEQAERERQAREAAEWAERAERERQALEAAERAAREAAEKEAAFQTPIPTVYFAKNSRRIADTYATQLESVLPILEKYPDFQLEIHAYASPAGRKTLNTWLSRKRMEAVRQWFIAHGVAPERIEKAYYHGVDYHARTARVARRAEIKFAR